uniref:DOMON domain-containing protein n=1 Tax=Timema monikensis TaxID=170555 RepID=A0A7R9HKI4_9NEOP|nr:unnamed protein product [Timema monikensis]
MGSMEPLRGYQGEDIEIQLPGSLTVYDIDWLAVWCVQYRHNFGHVLIPKDLDVPPALGQTKITTSSTTADPKEARSSNCRQLLKERLQVHWELQGDWVQIQLAARMREDQYMAFGLSGEQGRPSMVGGDVVVAFYDSEKGTFQAEDYYMSATAQCDGKNGVCPDERIGGRNDVTLVSGERKDGVTTIVYRRPLQTNEPINDRGIPVDGDVSVIAAIGPLNSRKEANAHAISDKTTDDIRIDFSSRDDHACTISLFDLPEETGLQPWPPAIITGENLFSVRIGPTGGKRGYTPLTAHRSILRRAVPTSYPPTQRDIQCSNLLPTSSPWYQVPSCPNLLPTSPLYNLMPNYNHPIQTNSSWSPILSCRQPSWGIAWYINDMLIPEIYVERGQTYSFVVEGGNDRTNPARYHPFYITDSKEGGFGQKSEADQKKQRVFGGVSYDAEGYPYPTAAGRYCEWTHKTIDKSAETQTFDSYLQTLRLVCDDGEPAYLNWTVVPETPEILYYQCYSHNNLGWKIHVVDAGYRSQRNGNTASLTHISPALTLGVLSITLVIAFTS